MTGRPKIAEDLEGMRQYLMVVNGPEKVVREERIRKSLKDLENDPIGRKVYLRLELMFVISKDLDKQKGVIFDFSAQQSSEAPVPNLMSGAIDAGKRILRSGKRLSFQEDLMTPKASTLSGSFQEGSTGFSMGLSETTASGTNLKKPKQRKRPCTYKRRAYGKGLAKGSTGNEQQVREGVMRS
ncbi:hypothetical protein Bca4012_010722 [Brassica carinata]